MVTLKPGVSLRGDGGRDVTVLDAERNGRLIRCRDVGGVRISGLTVTNGYLRLPSPNARGTGIYSSGDSRVVIAACTIRSNQTDGNLGAGIACDDQGSEITGCLIEGNLAAYLSGAAGVFMVGGVVSNCILRSNEAVGPFAAGAGMDARNSRIEQCVFEENVASGYDGAAGGGLSIEGGSVIGCSFLRNTAEATLEGTGWGGGSDSGSSTQISGCVFIGNVARGVGFRGRGGAISGRGGLGTLVVESCTIVGNVGEPEAISTGGIESIQPAALRNTILALNRGVACRAVMSTFCTDVWGNTAHSSACGTDLGGNLFADPLFCSLDPATAHDVEIAAESPCTAEASPCGLIGAGPVGCHRVGVRSLTWGGVKQLFR